MDRTERFAASRFGGIHNYSLWTLNETGEMDRKVADDIEDYEQAMDTARVNANDKDRPILVLDDARLEQDVAIVYPNE